MNAARILRQVCGPSAIGRRTERSIGRTARRRVRLCSFLSSLAVVAIWRAASRAQTDDKRSPASTSESGRFACFVPGAALRFGIPTPWITAVMQAESRGVVRAVSPKGAMGRMQIMPDTWSGLRSRYGLGADPFDPHDDILAGAAPLFPVRRGDGSTVSPPSSDGVSKQRPTAASAAD